MSAIFQLLTPPAFDDPGEQHQAATLLRMVLATASLAFVGLIVFGLIFIDLLNASVLLLCATATLISAGICIALIRHQRVKLAAKLFVLSTSALITYAAAMQFGALSLEVSYFLAPLAIAFLAVNRRWGVALAFGQVVILFVLGFLNLFGVIPEPGDIPLTGQVGIAIGHHSIIIMGVAVYFYSSKGAVERANRQVKANELRIRQMLDLMADSALQINLDGTIAAINTRATMMLGYDSADLVGQNVAVLTEGFNASDVQRNIDNMTINVPVIRQIPLRTKDGCELITERRSVRLKLESEEIVFTIIRDITDAVATQNALQDTASRLQLITDKIPVCIAYADQDQRIQFGNHEFVERFGGNFDEWRGHKVVDFVDPDVYVQLQPHITDAYAGIEKRFEYSVLDEENNPIEIAEVTYIPHFEKEKVVGIFSLAREVTEERKREAALRASQRLESLGLMAGGIAHDFNNLLAAILGQSALAALKLEGDHPASRHLKKSVQAAEKAGSLTKQMLAFSGRGQFEVRDIDLNELIEHNLHLFQSAISKQVQIDLNFEHSLPVIEADAAQIQQIVMNLIINAAQAIGDVPGKIVLETARRSVDSENADQWGRAGKPLEDGEYILFAITDDGCGMSQQQLDHIFEPFFSTKDEGSGLGLSAVLGIVRGHNGGIKVTSTEGVGTRFELLLPINEAGQVQQTISSDPTDDADASLLPGKVLVIDDEASVAETIADMLELRGIETVVANGGRDGLRLFEEQVASIGVVLLDLMMPEMNGEETFQRLRSIDPSVNIIITSGYSESETTKRFVGQDLAGFIQKPYQPRALLAKVAEALEATQLAEEKIADT